MREDTFGGDLLNQVWRDAWRREGWRVYRDALRRAVPFTLDAASTSLITTLASAPYDGRLQLYRELARLPYEVVWLELDYFAKINTQRRLGTRTADHERGNEPERMAYLIERIGETRWRSTTFVTVVATESRRREMELRLGRQIDLTDGVTITETMPPAFIVDTEGTIHGYKTQSRDAALHHAIQAMVDEPTAREMPWGIAANSDATTMRVLPGMADTATIDLPLDWEDMLIDKFPRPHERRDVMVNMLTGSLPEQLGAMRWVCAALATINTTREGSVIYEAKRGGSFRGGGMLRQYKTNRTVTIKVPGKRTTTVKNLLAAMRGAKRAMRRHQVRGFWRTTRKPDRPNEHWVWRYSPRYREHRWTIWVNEFERGDASLGWVSHDYEVTT